MSGKKLSDMSPIERVERCMEGMNWEEAEDVGVEILARCMSLHMSVYDEGEGYVKHLLGRLLDRTKEWTEEHLYMLAMARIGIKLEKEAKINENKKLK